MEISKATGTGPSTFSDATICKTFSRAPHETLTSRLVVLDKRLRRMGRAFKWAGATLAELSEELELLREILKVDEPFYHRPDKGPFYRHPPVKVFDSQIYRNPATIPTFRAKQRCRDIKRRHEARENGRKNANRKRNGSD